jgi:opacity protein-like surface antigen
MRNAFLLGILVICCASVGLAQNTPRAEFAAGFSIDSIDTGLGSATGISNASNRETGYGFDTSITGYFHKNLGIEGDFDGHFKSKTFNLASPNTGSSTARLSTYNFMGGPHVRFPTSNSKVTPFLHALLGGNHSSVSFDNNVQSLIGNARTSETDFALKLGGGIDVGVTKRAAIRLAADYNPVFERSQTINGVTLNGRTRNDALFSVGVVFK